MADKCADEHEVLYLLVANRVNAEDRWKERNRTYPLEISWTVGRASGRWSKASHEKSAEVIVVKSIEDEGPNLAVFNQFKVRQGASALSKTKDTWKEGAEAVAEAKFIQEQKPNR